jgi:hypothetical protein
MMDEASLQGTWFRFGRMMFRDCSASSFWNNHVATIEATSGKTKASRDGIRSWSEGKTSVMNQSLTPHGCDREEKVA